MKKRSLTIKGHATSISLEDEFWEELKDIAGQKGLSLNALVTMVDDKRHAANLSSALRIYILKQLKS